MLTIAIVIGSTRPGRKGEAVARWVLEQARERADARYELLDPQAFGLPLLDEPEPASSGRYSQPHTQAWAAAVARFDAFIFVTPEYNHGLSAALKNALDFLYREWNGKVAGIVGYGGIGAARAAEQLRLVLAELQMAVVRDQVMLTLRADWEEYRDFKPLPHQAKALAGVLAAVEAWGRALRPLRDG